MISPRTTQGVMELLPTQQLAFQRMLDTIRRGFERFGFLPIETPVFELTEVLLTKSGGETEKQVYFAQSTGARDKEIDALTAAVTTASGNTHSAFVVSLPELALRFDLTVPLARYVAEHEAQLNFPFRRYQIQRVYRGERAQKGRYREFYQCDIDVIGKDTLGVKHDAELPAVIYGIFKELEIGKFTIQLNNRRLIRGMLEALDVPEQKHVAVLHEVDKFGKQQTEIEKLGLLASHGILPAKGLELVRTLQPSESAMDAFARLDAFKARVQGFAAEFNPTFTSGLAELRSVYDLTLAAGVPANFLAIDLSIVRGLDYYTGTIYETFLDDQPSLGSICSGGRYENLAGLYTKSKLPGVGISIGATRLFSKLLEGVEAIEKAIVQLAKAKQDTGALEAQLADAQRRLHGGRAPSIATAIMLNVEPTLAHDCAKIANDLRRDLNVEVYGNEGKLDKQMKYADRAKIPFVLIYGTTEHAAGEVRVKDMRTGKQENVKRAELAAWIRASLATA